MNATDQTDDPYHREPGSWKDPPKTLGGMMRYWGPGLILTASVVGSGELIATTGLGAKTGFVALWLILLSCVIKVAIQLILGRYAIYSGETTLHSFDGLPGPRLRASWFVWLWLFVLLMVTMQQGAMLGGVAMVLNLLVPTVDVWFWAILMAGLTILLLRGGRYSVLEHASMVMVAIFTLTTLVSVGMLQGTDYEASWDDIRRGLAFQLPAGGISVAMAMFGITGVGATELIFYPYVCLEKGYARSVGVFEKTDAWLARARGWIRTMHLDALLSMIIYTSLTLAFYVLGATVLHSRSVVPERMEMVSNLSLMYTETLGPGARLVFLVGALCALYSTIFVSTAANARMFTDCFDLLGWVRVQGEFDRRRWITVFVTIMPVVQFFLFLAFRRPLWMVVVGGTVQAVSLIAISLGALYLGKKKLVADLAPSRLFSGIIWGSALCIVTVAVAGIVIQLAQFEVEEPRPVEFARFDAYSEGPVFDYEGNLFVSHGKSTVAKISPDGRLSSWLEVDNPNGHKILPDGTHLLCVRGAVLHLARDATLIREASTHCDNVPLRSPNDITLAADGGFYFTDPGGSRIAPIGTVHYVDNQGITHRVADGLRVPNGLVLSPDRDRLYVAETVPNRVLWFEVKPDGKLGRLNVFADLPSKPDVQAEPDGLAVDSDGNLYVAHLGMSSVQVLDASGELIRTLPAGNYDASNLVFGGRQLDQLFITGSTGHRRNTPGRVYRLHLPGVTGVSSLLPRHPL